MVTFVSGNPGSGKSTLTVELQRRGIRALDADAVPGLAAWMDGTGAVVGDGSLVPTPELLATCWWGWSAERLDELVETLGGDGVLLGIAVNQWEFLHRFDTMVLLELDESTQEARVSDRDPLFRAQIAAGRPVLQSQMIDRGAARVDARQPAAAVAAAVIALLR